MNIVLCVKHVPDTESTIRITPDGTGIETAHLNFVLNPYDEYAVEEAVRLKESLEGTKITVVCIGPEDATKSIRTALAMGADEGLHILDPTYQRFDGITTARILAKALKDLDFDIILCGKQAVDDDMGQVGPALAEMLELPGVSVVNRFELGDDQRTATVERQIEGANEVVEVVLPAVLTAQKGLNEPRLPSLPNIMKARKKPLRTVNVAELELTDSDLKPQVEITQFLTPPKRQAGKLLEGPSEEMVRELVKLLKEEAKVL
jgi:electron transfer flavoprotein beta subunit